MSTVFRPSLGSMFFAAIVAIILGLVMLWYPGGIMALIAVTFWALQVMISVFILSYMITEAVRYFRAGKVFGGIAYLIIGIAATLFVWFFKVNFFYLVVAVFFIVSGVSDIIGGFALAAGRYFFIFLGFMNIMIGIVMIQYPVILPLLIAWYVLFWGISRLLLAFELKRLVA
jgi:uncharacterized membrane protein HdeD (DUF308 family)